MFYPTQASSSNASNQSKNLLFFQNADSRQMNVFTFVSDNQNLQIHRMATRSLTEKFRAWRSLRPAHEDVPMLHAQANWVQDIETGRRCLADAKHKFRQLTRQQTATLRVSFDESKLANDGDVAILSSSILERLKLISQLMRSLSNVPLPPEERQIRTNAVAALHLDVSTFTREFQKSQREYQTALIPFQTDETTATTHIVSDDQCFYVSQEDADRHDRISQLASHVEKINQLFLDLQHLVQDQELSVVRIDDHISQARHHVHKGTERLSQAPRHSLTWPCCLGILFMILVVLVTILVVKYK